MQHKRFLKQQRHRQYAERKREKHAAQARARRAHHSASKYSPRAQRTRTISGRAAQSMAKHGQINALLSLLGGRTR